MPTLFPYPSYFIVAIGMLFKGVHGSLPYLSGHHSGVSPFASSENLINGASQDLDEIHMNDNSPGVNLGTTLVAIKYSGGVVVGADTRTSVSGYVSNKFAHKISPVIQVKGTNNNDFKDGDLPRSSSCVLCRSGSAADTQYLARKARHEFHVRTLRRPGYVPTVSQVAHFVRHQVRQYNAEPSSDLMASLICAGYDDNGVNGNGRIEEGGDGGGRIFGISPGGSLWEEDFFCVSGSGSTLLLGFLDSLNMKEVCTGYTKRQAVELVTKLLRLSIARDGSTGGLVRIMAIDKTGLEEVTIYPQLSSGGRSFVADNSSGANERSSLIEGQAKDLPGFAHRT
jgi:20S proteasome subunit beta 1